MTPALPVTADYQAGHLSPRGAARDRRVEPGDDDALPPPLVMADDGVGRLSPHGAAMGPPDDPPIRLGEGDDALSPPVVMAGHRAGHLSPHGRAKGPPDQVGHDGRRGGVLITRPEPGASETAARVAAMGLSPIVVPFLEIRPVPVHLPPPERIVAILLASGSAVDPLPARCHAIPVLTVGAATARRAKTAGFAKVISADGDASDLVALVRARIDPRYGTLLLAAGRGQSLTLAADLRRSGYRVARRVVYAAQPVASLPAAARAALMNDQARTVLFFSAETARCFMRLVQRAGLIGTLSSREAITIGGKVGMALKAAYWARVSVAGKPTQDHMLALLR